MADPQPPGRAYTAPGVTVYFDARRCIHFGACVRNLPEVFDKSARPWIRADGASLERVTAVVRGCPTGALTYTLTDGPVEQPDTPTSVEPQANGPLFVRGNLAIATADGEQRVTRAALCRCGHSDNKPFCDGSHTRANWRSAASSDI